MFLIFLEKLYRIKLYINCRIMSIGFCRIKFQPDYKFQQGKIIYGNMGEWTNCPHKKDTVRRILVSTLSFRYHLVYHNTSDAN